MADRKFRLRRSPPKLGNSCIDPVATNGYKMPHYLGHENSKQITLLSQFQDKNN